MVANLIFQKRLTASDVYDLKLSIPTIALQCLPPFRPDSNRMILPVRDEQSGIRFDFECCRRATGYPIPVFTGEWRDYVRTKAVMAGDNVVFSRVADQPGGGVHYKITVFRRSLRLFGVTIPVADA